MLQNSRDASVGSGSDTATVLVRSRQITERVLIRMDSLIVTIGRYMYLLSVVFRMQTRLTCSSTGAGDEKASSLSD